MPDEENGDTKSRSCLSHVFSLCLIYHYCGERGGGHHSEGQAAERGAQLWLSAQRKKQQWWKGGSLQSVSLHWSVMSALLLKIAQERTTGVKRWMRVRVQLVVPWGTGDTGDRCVQTCDVRVATKNNPRDIQHVVRLRWEKLDSTVNVEM